MEMTPERWSYLAGYGASLFGAEDDDLVRVRLEAERAGLPDIAVSAEVGRLLRLLVMTTRAQLAVEVGTLGGYSGIWIARSLAPGGRLITIEKEPAHAAFAREQFVRARVGGTVEVRVGRALDVLPSLAAELGPGSVDVAFIDADKSEYPEYWRLVRPLIAPGGMLVADNVYAARFWIGDEGEPEREAVHRFNAAVASDPDFDSIAVPLRNGVLIARRRT